MENNLIVIPKEIPKTKVLYKEFKYAWNNTSYEMKKKWALDSIKLLGKVTIRRGKGLIKTVGKLLLFSAGEVAGLAGAVVGKRTINHLSGRKKRAFESIKNLGKKSKSVINNTIYLLRNNPKETGPILFLGVLGFFCGAGTQIGEKTFYDIDGGIPDLDWKVGEMTNIDLLKHRSPFFHSFISAAVLETMVFCSVNAIKIIHSKLPGEHDSFWDQVVSKGNWAEAFVTGACTGIAYHLLLDGTLDGGGHLAGLSSTLDMSMPHSAHQAFFVTNAAAEALDLDKKKIK